MKTKHRAPRLAALLLCLVLLFTACSSPFPFGFDLLGTGDSRPRNIVHYSEMAYERPDLDAMRTALPEMTGRLENASSYAEVQEISEECGVLFTNFNTMYTLAMLAKYHDVNDSYFEEEYRLLEEAGVEFGNLLNDFYRAIIGGPYATDYEQEVGEYYYQSILDDLRLNSPEVEAYKQERTQLNADYNKLLATVGEGNYNAHVDQFAELYARIIQLDKLTAETLGFSSAAEMYYLSYSRDYTPSEGLQLCENAKRYFVPLMPVLNAYWYDSGAADMDEAFASMPGALTKVDPQLAEAWNFMMQYGVYDCEPLEGKQQGIAFCTNLYGYDTGFIYSYWDDTFSAATTIMHEFGHFYDNWLHYDEAAVFNLDIAETYSQGLELLMHSYYSDFTTSRYAEQAAMENLQSFGVDVLIFQSLLEEFQHRVYTLESPDAVSIGRIYANLMEEYGLYELYRDYGVPLPVDENGADNSWYRVTHLFDAPFYTISYVTSAVAALQIWAVAQQDQDEAVQIYMDLIHADQNQSFTSLLESVGLKPVHQPAVLEEIAGYFEDIFY